LYEQQSEQNLDVLESSQRHLVVVRGDIRGAWRESVQVQDLFVDLVLRQNRVGLFKTRLPVDKAKHGARDQTCNPRTVLLSGETHTALTASSLCDLLDTSDQLGWDDEEQLGVLHHERGHAGQDRVASLQLLRFEPSWTEEVGHEDRRQGGGRHLVLRLPRRGAMEHVEQVFQ